MLCLDRKALPDKPFPTAGSCEVLTISRPSVEVLPSNTAIVCGATGFAWPADIGHILGFTDCEFNGPSAGRCQGRGRLG